MKQAILKQLQVIPGVGKSISQDLYDLGVRSVADLKEKDPEEMYAELCDMRGMHIDRCMLYVFRCAVYFAQSADSRGLNRGQTRKGISGHSHEKLLKWWNWKDKE